MNKKSQVYDVSAELERELGAAGAAERERQTEKAWEEYNAQIFQEARKAARLTQAELGARIGADKAYISKVERGLTVPSVATFYKLASAMGLTVRLQPAL